MYVACGTGRDYNLATMEPTIIDTHAHLDMPEFDADRAAVIARARDAGVETIVSVGTDLESSRKAIALAEEYPGVFATVGFHPHEAAHMKEADVALLAELTKRPRVIAIGELGLDYYRNRAPREVQLQALKWQLGLAEKLGLPVVIHCRQAEKDMLLLLRDWTSSRRSNRASPVGVIHCFSGDMETARQYLDMGFFISLGAYIGYPSSLHRADVIRAIPSDRLMVETDSPFLPPQAHRGKRNEPSYLPATVQVIAEMRKVAPPVIAGETTQNARRLFHNLEL